MFNVPAVSAVHLVTYVLRVITTLQNCFHQKVLVGWAENLGERKPRGRQVMPHKQSSSNHYATELLPSIGARRMGGKLRREGTSWKTGNASQAAVELELTAARSAATLRKKTLPIQTAVSSVSGGKTVCHRLVPLDLLPVFSVSAEEETPVPLFAAVPTRTTLTILSRVDPPSALHQVLFTSWVLRRESNNSTSQLAVQS